MDDPLLARARLLVKIGNDVHAATAASTEIMKKNAQSLNVAVSDVSSPSRAAPSQSFVDSPTHSRSEYDHHHQQQQREGDAHGASPSATGTAGGSPNNSNPYAGVTKFKVSVIRGSTLVSCLSGGDVRTMLKRGSVVEIEGVEYKLSTKVGSEWSGNRIELEGDYGGDTKLNAFMTVRNRAKRSPKKARNVEPIPSSEIFDAIRGLDDILPPSMTMDSSSSNSNRGGGEVRRGNMNKSMNLHHPRERGYSAAHTGGSSSSKPAPGGDELSASSRSLLREAHRTGNNNSSSSSSSTNSNSNNYPNSYSGSAPGGLSPSLSQSGIGTGTGMGMGEATVVSSSPVSSPTRQRSPPKVLSAMQQDNNNNNDNDNNEYRSYSSQYSTQARSTHLESQRKAAMERAQRRRQEDAAAEKAKQHEEAKLKQAKKVVMDARASALQARTRQRVAKLKAERKQETVEKEQLQQAEAARKRQSQEVAGSEAYVFCSVGLPSFSCL
jgi:hypothetical protein